ncbi:DUF2381 family protein [Myxococcus sp. RHSTA-1-4]|uniref:DUF2381 family protein n=1 Tax=Myxococcus sp. RHSTA-1-4 TaxID=2874601 RepID=UPI001CBB4AC0|nr:DUF2381 family protein [Myxococcus sp. RHSTA-1-4]MBZ4416118.1 DUF2381 family protein [Myxococcus sp. RHSTA-1-4]
MSLPESLVVAVWMVLVGTVAMAQPPESVGQKARVILLKGDEAPTPHVLRMAPDTTTVVLFDSPVVRESVDTRLLQGLFTRVQVNEELLVLRPAVEFPVNPALRLAVRFADGKAPRQVEFVLTSQPDAPDLQVEVVREGRSEEQLVSELARLRGLCAATEAGLAPLRARCARAGLGGLFVSGEMDADNGVRAHRPEAMPTEMGLEWMRATLFRTGATVMVGAEVKNPSGGTPWLADSARLVRLNARSEPLEETRLLPVVMEPERLAPGRSARIAVQWEEPSQTHATSVRLEVVDASGRGLKWERLELQPPVVNVPRAPRGRKEGRP